jgi:hypothetical protein
VRASGGAARFLLFKWNGHFASPWKNCLVGAWAGKISPSLQFALSSAQVGGIVTGDVGGWLRSRLAARMVNSNFQ